MAGRCDPAAILFGTQHERQGWPDPLDELLAVVAARGLGIGSWEGSRIIDYCLSQDPSFLDPVVPLEVAELRPIAAEDYARLLGAWLSHLWTTGRPSQGRRFDGDPQLLQAMIRLRDCCISDHGRPWFRSVEALPTDRELAELIFWEHPSINTCRDQVAKCIATLGGRR